LFDIPWIVLVLLLLVVVVEGLGKYANHDRFNSL
jgi:Na+-transporting methylmalonyl-CoA/oxaloacetate decarboxylase gamma subunit